MEYIHWNPTKHGLVEKPRDWPFSSFHSYVRKGLYPELDAVRKLTASYVLNGSKRRNIVPKKTHHVVPNSDGGWDVKKGGGERSIKHFNKKQDAVDFGRGVSKNQESELVVHKKNGTIQNPDSHGGDPCPPKDKK